MTQDCCPRCGDENPRIAIRATERGEVWGRDQVMECRHCNRRWVV